MSGSGIASVIEINPVAIDDTPSTEDSDPGPLTGEPCAANAFGEYHAIIEDKTSKRVLSYLGLPRLTAPLNDRSLRIRQFQITNHLMLMENLGFLIVDGQSTMFGRRNYIYEERRYFNSGVSDSCVVIVVVLLLLRYLVRDIDDIQPMHDKWEPELAQHLPPMLMYIVRPNITDGRRIPQILYTLFKKGWISPCVFATLVRGNWSLKRSMLSKTMPSYTLTFDDASNYDAWLGPSPLTRRIVGLLTMCPHKSFRDIDVTSYRRVHRP